MTNLINGKEIAQNLRDSIKKEIEDIKSEIGKVPGLAVVQVGNVAASNIYVKAKTKSAKEVGIEVIDHHLPEKTTQEELLKIIQSLNNQDNVNGILVQLPLPKHINEQIILDSIHPNKDADGFHPLNVGKLSIASNNDESLLIPCTPYGCLIMLKGLGINLSGKNAVVIGRSNIVGKPMAALLLHKNATVTICHSRTVNLAQVASTADILVAAIGRPAFVRRAFVKPGATVIDVGMNRLDDRAQVEDIFGPESRKMAAFEKRGAVVTGDVHPEVSAVAGALTPVPGGVGPLTIAVLMSNTIRAAELRLAETKRQL